MRFLLDANIPYSAKEIFEKPHLVFHVKDVTLADAEDEKIVSWAKQHKRVLQEFLEKAGMEKFSKAIFIVEEGRFRVRR